jgi:hypothetical protein
MGEEILPRASGRRKERLMGRIGWAFDDILAYLNILDKVDPEAFTRALEGAGHSVRNV